MRATSLLSFIGRSSGSPEDTATDALHFILENRENIRGALLRFLNASIPGLPPILWLEARTGTGSAGIPDIVGFSGPATVALIIENKFWAGLTPHQPASYLKKLAPGGVLLFVVPTTRQRGVWEQVTERLQHMGPSYVLLSSPIEAGGLTHQRVQIEGAVNTIALTTWSSLIGAIRPQGPGDADIDQLRGLCDDMENRKMFTPMSPSDLHDQRLPARISNILSLLTAIRESAEQFGFHVRESSAKDEGTSDFKDGSMGYFFGFELVTDSSAKHIWFGIHLRLWELIGTSPLWLGINVRRSADRDRLLESMIRIEQARNATSSTRQQWFVPEQTLGDEHAYLAIDVPNDAPQENVIEAVMEQIKDIARLVLGT